MNKYMAKTTAVKIETKTKTLATVALVLAGVAVLGAWALMFLVGSGPGILTDLEGRAGGVFGDRAEKPNCECFGSQNEECCSCTWSDGSRGSACRSK